MKTAAKVAIGGGVLLLGYLLFGKKNPDGSISIGVDKTSGECAPGGSKYGTSACSASDNPIDAVTGALGDAANTVKDALGGLLGGGKGASDPQIPTYDPMGPKTDDAGARIATAAARSGSDGPITPTLQITKGAGSMLDEGVATHGTTKLSHR